MTAAGTAATVVFATELLGLPAGGGSINKVKLRTIFPVLQRSSNKSWTTGSLTGCSPITWMKALPAPRFCSDIFKPLIKAL